MRNASPVITRLTCHDLWRNLCAMAQDIFPLVDRLVPGGLAPMLEVARKAGKSHETIARELANDHDVTVSAETVRRWCARPAAPASVGS